jgi:uroporphyrinogen-III decarboxylase
VSGPLSLALSLIDPEDFFMGTIDDPGYCQRVLEFCADVILAFGRAYLDAGVGVIMFDSQASPDLFSADMFEEMVLPHTQRVTAGLQDAGETVCPLIIGGNTTRLANACARTGSRQILCDFSADWNTYRQVCTDQRLAVRRNISPSEIENGKPDELAATAREYLAAADGMPGFILGTAVLPFGTPTRNVLAIRDAIRR